jgi:hypothetical protein
MAAGNLPSFTSSRTADDPEEKYETHNEYTWTGDSDVNRKLKSITVWNDFKPDHKLEYIASSKTVRVLGSAAAPLNLHIHLTNQLVRIAGQYS